MNLNGVSRRAMLLTPLALRPLRAQADDSLKVTKFVIRMAQVRVAWRTLVMFEIHTDGGLIGLGEATLPLRPKIVAEALRWLEPRLVGLHKRDRRYISNDQRSGRSSDSRWAGFGN